MVSPLPPPLLNRPAHTTAFPPRQAGPEYGVLGSPDGHFNNFNTLFRSSALDRAIMTARSFLDGVFPPVNQATATTYLPDGQQARFWSRRHFLHSSRLLLWGPRGRVTGRGHGGVVLQRSLGYRGCRQQPPGTP
jgi:hypothetical protein